MAQQHFSTSPSKECTLKTDECETCLLSLLPSENLTINPVSGLNTPTPPTSLPLSTQSMPWMGDVQAQPLVPAEDSAPSVSEECSSTVGLPVQPSPHECSLCHKMFQTNKALNKHLLMHQQERPHVCSICQRAFKRHDHLNSHMLTHQKHKRFQCAEPGCWKNYSDPHSLKRHHTSKHTTPFIAPNTQTPPRPTRSAAPQWEPVDKPAGLCGASAASSEYHSLFPDSPPQPEADRHQNSPDYSGFSSYSSSAGLAPQHGLQTKLCSEQNLPLPKSVVALGQLKQDPCNSCTGELHLSQSGPEPRAQAQTQAQLSSTANVTTLPPGVEGPNPPSWDSGIDLIVSNLQTLEEMWSDQPYSWPDNSKGDRLLKSASPTDTQSEQHSTTEQTHGQMSSEGSAQEKPPLYSFENHKHAACSFPIMPSKSISPPAVFSHSGSALPNKPNPGLQPPAIVPPSLYRGVKSKACPDGVDRKRKMSERRRKVQSADLPAQPRPLHLVSPSQVAMASFSYSSCRLIKEGNLTKLGKGQEVTHSSQHGKRSRASGRPTGPSIKIECHSPESENRGSPSERPEDMALSPLVIPVSVPVSVKTEADMVETEHSRHSSVDLSMVGKTQGGTSSHQLDSMQGLIIPSPVLPPLSPWHLLGEEGGVRGPWGRAAGGGYSSQLRSPMYLTDHLLNPVFQPPPYTPPPMLSPLRPGTGLYFSTLPPPPHPCPPPLSTYTATLDGSDGISLVMDDTVVKIKPRINVGQRFQAEVPPLRNMLLMLYDEHPAQLVWAPWGDLSSSTDTQKRVTELLVLCCSSVLPGGGTNTELALHCLHEVQGDILAALHLLLIRGDYRSSSHCLSDYHYPGSDHWTPLEERVFRKALLTHEKDFQLIHTELRTKSVSQCVEYYYGMKKLKKFKQRCGVSKKEGADAESMPSPGHSEDLPAGWQGPRRTLTTPGYSTVGQQEPAISGGALEYACGQCGRIFDRVKSRNAHMKSHRQQQRQWLSGYVRSSGGVSPESR